MKYIDSIKCPECPARRHEYCQTKKGVVRHKFHYLRIKLFEALK